MSSSPSRSTSSQVAQDEVFQHAVLYLVQDLQASTPDLVHRASTALHSIESSSLSVSVGEKTLPVFKLLTAVLESATYCGGQRYIASAIISAHHQAPDSLTNLAQDWLSFLVWPIYKASRRPESRSSEFSTPTLEEFAVIAEGVRPNRVHNFRSTLLERDGDRCVITRWWDVEAKEADDPDNTSIVLQAAHILRCSVMLDLGGSSPHVLPATLDILRHFADLPDDLSNNLAEILDSPENGMMLAIYLHSAFEKLLWCLLPVEGTPNKYTMEWFKPSGILPGTHHIKEITFQNHSTCQINLPNPKFIAIHAAFSHVLHLSGAGEVLGDVYNRFFDTNGEAPSGKHGSSDEFSLRLSLMNMFESGKRPQSHDRVPVS